MVERLQQSELFQEYRQAFEAITGLPLVLREAGSFRTPLQGSSRLNPFCGLMTKANKTCASCLQLQQRLEEDATLEPKTLQCYAGLSESVVPVRVGQTVPAYLQTGQVFLQAPSKKYFKNISHVVQSGSSGADTRALKSAYFRTRVVTRKQYESAIRLLAIFAKHLATVSNQILLQEATVEPAVVTRGRTFIAEHQNEEICLTDVARAVNMSVFYFCKIFKQAIGLSFSEYVARARVESVKVKLLNAHLRVSEAAFAAGFQSLSQFNRVFLRVSGETPSSYRERANAVNGKSHGGVTAIRLA
jgi:AraC-like DNA-binding protein